MGASNGFFRTLRESGSFSSSSRSLDSISVSLNSAIDI